MTFTWPLVLLALITVPLALIAYVIYQRRRDNYAIRFTNLDLLATVVDRTPGWRRHIPPVLALTALSALLLAAARPEMTEKIPREHATVILVSDSSGSMLAKDVDPTRHAAAIAAAKTLLDSVPKNTKVGLVTFSDFVDVAVEPTEEHDLVRRALDRMIPEGGTAMGEALSRGVEVATREAEQAEADVAGTPTPGPATINPDGPPPVVIVLLSDGYNTAGDLEPLDAAQEALAAGIPVYTIALGTEEGYVEQLNRAGQLRRIPVPPDEETLAAIAENTGGRFFSAPSAEELESIYSDIGSRVAYTEEKTEVTWAFALAGALFLAFGSVTSLAWFNRFP